MVAEAKNKASSEDSKKSGEILYLPCEKLEANPLHMGFYAQSHIEGLVESMREVGLLEPVIVYPLEKGEYRILSGHYRVKAARRLRWKQILCRMVSCDARSSVALYCTSNLLTRNLSPIEEAYMISRLVSEEKFTFAEIGKLWGRSKSWVSRRLGLLVHLAPRIKNELGTGHLSPRVAQELLRLPRGNEQERVLAIIRKHKLNKNEAAELITRWKMASEEERSKIEKSNFHKDDKNFNSKGTDDELKKLAFERLYQCRESLKQIINIIKEQKSLSWWPQEIYLSFCQESQILMNMLEHRFGSI